MPSARSVSLFQRVNAWARDPRVWRWGLIGFGFLGFNLGLLYLLVDVMGVPFALAPLIAGEFCLVLRFLANDRWVFGHARPTWKRLAEYHVAIAGGFAVWWLAANLLAHFGLHYLLASIAATGASVLFNFFSNFCWIWTRKSPGDAVAMKTQP